MATCPYCGKPNSDTQSNCAYCGEPLGGNSADSNTGGYTAETNDYGDFGGSAPTPTPPPAPKKKSKLGLYIGGGVLGAAVIAGIVFFVLTMMSPMRTIASAANKTMSALTERVGSFSTLEDFADACTNAADTRHTKENINLSLGLPDSDALYLSIDGITDHNAHTGSAELALGFENGNSFNIPITVDDDGYTLAAPQLVEDTLLKMSHEGIANWLSEEMDTSLTADEINPFLMTENTSITDVDAEMTALKSAITTLFANMETEKQETYAHGNHQWTPYRLICQQEDIEAVKSSLTALVNRAVEITKRGDELTDEDIAEVVDEIGFMLNNMTVCIDERGYLVAVSMTDSTDSTLRIALEGDENPWDKYCFYNDDEPLFWGEITNTDGTLSVTMGDDTDTLRLSYTDSTGNFSLEFPDVYTISGYARDNNGTAELYITTGDSYFFELDLTYTLSATNETSKTLSGTTVYDVFTMTEDDTNALLMDAMMTLYTDSELNQLLTDISEFFQNLGVDDLGL